MTPLARRILARLAAGPMPFATWMDLALYGDEAGGGFYQAAAHPAGRHYVTSPTLHPFFGRAVAAEVEAAWQAAGRPETFVVVEPGGGDGTLRRQALDHLDIEGLRWHVVDPARGLPDWPRTKGGLLVANEWLDAIPAPWLRRTRDGWMSVEVMAHGEDFVAFLAPTRTPSTTDDQFVPMEPAASALEQALACGIDRAILIDYGGPRPSRGMRAFHEQQPASPLAPPGTVDITYDLDTRALTAAAQRAGFAARVESQETFLLRHGILDALNAIPRDSTEGASSYLRLRQLLLPTGLGSFFVQHLAKP